MANIVFSKGSGLQKSIYGDCQGPVKLIIEKKAESFEAKSVLGEIYTMDKSNHASETFTSMTAMNGFEPTGEGGQYPLDGMQEGHSKTIKHMTWKDSFALTQEIIDDTKMIDLKQKPGQFTTGYYRTRETFGAAMMGAAIAGQKELTFGGKKFDTSAADGEAFFSAAHPSIINKKFIQSNKFSDAFSEDALAAAESAMQNFRGDNEEILAIAPTTIVIANDYKLKKAVFAAIGADKDPSSANNGFNFLFGRWRVIVWNDLNRYIKNGVAPWMLLDKSYNEDCKSAIWLDREAFNVKSIIDESNDNNVWKGRARFGVGFNDWRGFCVGGIEGGTALLGE